MILATWGNGSARGFPALDLPFLEASKLVAFIELTSTIISEIPALLALPVIFALLLSLVLLYVRAIYNCFIPFLGPRSHRRHPVINIFIRGLAPRVVLLRKFLHPFHNCTQLTIATQALLQMQTVPG